MGGRHVMFGRPVVIAALVTGLVTGCSSGQRSAEADVGPTPTRVTSPATPSSTVTPGVLDDVARARIPKAARAHTPAGAEAFARFYLEQLNLAWTSPDPNLIHPYGLQSCKTCANYVDTASWLAANHFHYNGPPTELGPSIVAPESKDDRVFIEITANQEARDILDESGNVQESWPHKFMGAQVEVVWHATDWVIREVRVSQ